MKHKGQPPQQQSPPGIDASTITSLPSSYTFRPSVIIQGGFTLNNF